jgi:predicted dehydrogenase
VPTNYRVGVIGRTGHGDYGHHLDMAWKDVPGAKVVAVADDDKMGLAAAAKRHEVDQAFSDYREMLDKAKPDVVTICPRWIDQHRDMVVAAAERGIHMYIEKPLSRSLQEADEMINACERTHTKAVIAHQTRYSPKLAVVKQLVDEGRIGDVLEYRGRGKEDARGGGEDLWVLGTHIFDMIRTIGGDAQWCFAQVKQDGRPISKADVREGPEGIGPLAGDALQAVYEMSTGATAYFASRRNAGNGKRFALQVFGTAGVIEILMGFMPSVKYLKDPTWSPGRSKAKWQDVSTAGIDQPEPLQDPGIHGGNVLAVKDLLAAIEENRQPLGNIYEARAATEMIVSVFESQRVGGPVKLPLENRKNPLTMLA